MSRCPCLEIAAYSVESVMEADHQRSLAAERVAALPGFAGWLPVEGCRNPEQRADLVIWSDRQSADDAAVIVGSSEEFAAFRATIAKLGAIDHYALPSGGLPLLQAGDGIEIGRFRLRAGVTEAMLREAHEWMVGRHLSRLPGWRGQRLARLDGDIWLDIAFAESDDKARAICASWTGNRECEAFLALIEPISMEFGTFA